MGNERRVQAELLGTVGAGVAVVSPHVLITQCCGQVQMTPRKEKLVVTIKCIKCWNTVRVDMLVCKSGEHMHLAEPLPEGWQVFDGEVYCPHCLQPEKET